MARRWGRAPRMTAATLAVAGLVAATMTGCSALSGSASTGGGNSITLYSGQHLQTTQKLVAAFEKQTGITVSVRSNDEAVLADQIVTEGARSPADVFYTENTPPLELLQGKGLLSTVRSSTLAATPSRYNSPQGDWAGVSARVSVLIYNPRLISRSQLPTSVMQLADPKYKGKIALAAGETDFQPIVTSVLRAHGTAATEKWLNAVKANAAGHLYPDNETVTSDVNRGSAAVGIINQYYWYRLRAEIGAGATHSAIAFFAPRDPGYVLDVSGAAVLKSSTHQAAAQRFLAFLVSKPAQEIIGGHSLSYEYPIASGVITAAPETPFSQLQPNPITLGELGTGSAAIALLRRAGLL
ncbi:MAG: iron(III) transport system substrate-binding protein [Streptosporangiaceae bacterium]|jgi:iron(III) transport system substrate-binding protein|nr:iron(III) transport system substrate-binding protein [Streptosporangiaceae bacterium]